MEETNRKRSVQYDEVLKRQRNLIYETRENLLGGARIEKETIFSIARETIRDYLALSPKLEPTDLNRFILDNLSYSLDGKLKEIDLNNKDAVENYLMRLVHQGISRQKSRIDNDEAYEQFVREATLTAVDDGWVELVDYLEQLKYAVAGRASAQRNVMLEYQDEAFDSYLDTGKVVKRNIIRNILLSDVTIGEKNRLFIIYP